MSVEEGKDLRLLLDPAHSAPGADPHSALPPAGEEPSVRPVLCKTSAPWTEPDLAQVPQNARIATLGQERSGRNRPRRKKVRVDTKIRAH
jgi:hypothetical protein